MAGFRFFLVLFALFATPARALEPPDWFIDRLNAGVAGAGVPSAFTRAACIETGCLYRSGPDMRAFINRSPLSGIALIWTGRPGSEHAFAVATSAAASLILGDERLAADVVAKVANRSPEPDSAISVGDVVVMLRRHNGEIIFTITPR